MNCVFCWFGVLVTLIPAPVLTHLNFLYKEWNFLLAYIGTSLGGYFSRLSVHEISCRCISIASEREGFLVSSVGMLSITAWQRSGYLGTSNTLSQTKILLLWRAVQSWWSISLPNSMQSGHFRTIDWWTTPQTDRLSIRFSLLKNRDRASSFWAPSFEFRFGGFI